MYEGKNIHFSAVDNKALCSCSAKVCKQRRLNGYAFCLRHILEDPTAPFKQCMHQAKNRQCLNPVPRSAQSEFCNCHNNEAKSPIKAKKKASAPSSSPSSMSSSPQLPIEALRVNGISSSGESSSYSSIQDRIKSRLLFAPRHVTAKDSDVEDPYAFPDVDPVEKSSATSLTKLNLSGSSPSSSLPFSSSSTGSMSPTTPIHSKLTPGSWALTQVSPVSKTDRQLNATSIAKLYPELAEKLERVKTKSSEPKSNKVAKSSNSRTMNRLQTKIAQNKIKDKLKNKSQSASTTPEQQPSTPLTPVTLIGSCSPNPASIAENKPQASPMGTLDFISTPCGPHPRDAYNNLKSQADSLPLTSVENVSMTTTTAINSLLSATPAPVMSCRASSGSSSSISHLLRSPPLNNLNLLSPKPPPPDLCKAAPQPVSPAVTNNSVVKTEVVSPVPPIKEEPSAVDWEVGMGGEEKQSVPKVSCVKLKRPRNLWSESEAKRKLRRRSAVRTYAYHASEKVHNADLLPMGIDSSDESDADDLLPWQHNWLLSSSDEESLDEEVDEELASNIRKTKLVLHKSKLRRQFSQFRHMLRGNASQRNHILGDLRALLVSARSSSVACVRALAATAPHQSSEPNVCRKALRASACLHSDNGDKCHADALPFTNHCSKHIMYNVDQQMYQYCTAKFSDNTQCCIPVFDPRHELPLCPEHAAKADNYEKNHEPRPKKPRKKTKPSALTRPPKKGKKKKNQRKKPQKPIIETTSGIFLSSPPHEKSPGFTPSIKQEQETCGENHLLNGHTPTSIMSSQAMPPITQPSSHTSHSSIGLGGLVSPPTYANQSSGSSNQLQSSFKDTDPLNDIGSTFLSGAIEKELELDTEQATKFLDEHDLHDVLNKLPDEAFDLLAGCADDKNGAFGDNPALDRAWAEVSQDLSKVSIDALSLAGDAASITMSLSSDPSPLTSSTMTSTTSQLPHPSSSDLQNEDEITKQIAVSLLNHNPISPTGSMGDDDDLGHDNLNDLASSLSANDLKNISQVLSGSLFNSALGIESGSITSSTPAPDPQTSLHFPVLQSSLKQPPLQTLPQVSKGPICTVLPTSCAKGPVLGGTSSGLTFNPTVVQVTDHHLQQQMAASLPLLDHVNLPAAQKQTEKTASFLQNGIPPPATASSAASHLPLQQIPGAGLKLAYPLQTLIPGCPGGIMTPGIQPTTLSTQPIPGGPPPIFAITTSMPHAPSSVAKSASQL